MISTYNEAIHHVCYQLNELDDEFKHNESNFTPVFETTSFFCIYYYDPSFEEEYFLINKDNDKFRCILNNTPDFIGSNELSVMTHEKLLHVHNKELMETLLIYSERYSKDFYDHAHLIGLYNFKNEYDLYKSKNTLIYKIYNLSHNNNSLKETTHNKDDKER